MIPVDHPLRKRGDLNDEIAKVKIKPSADAGRG